MWNLPSVLLLLFFASSGSSREVISKHVCENSGIAVECPSKKVINVISVLYGRDNEVTCGEYHVTNCRAAGSENFVYETCQEKQSCFLQASNDVFGDPCPGVPKFLKVEYTCELTDRYRPKRAIACEHSRPVEVVCGENEVIAIIDGFYGRDNVSAQACPGNIFDTNCAASNSLATLRNDCDGLNRCTLYPNNRVFGDPCKYTNKLIKMNYYCVKKVATFLSLNTAVACEHQDEVKVYCPDGHVILVADSFYGRNDRETCPGVDYDTNCYAEDSFKRLQLECDGEQSCLLQASNSVFGDPCVRTNKYIKLNYFCVPKPDANLQDVVACEHHSPVTVNCPSGKEILVAGGFYGRDLDPNNDCPGNVFTTDCKAAGSQTILQNLCDGKTSCVLNPSNAVFGDPCVETNKLIRMQYYCL